MTLGYTPELFSQSLSLPARECGLKLVFDISEMGEEPSLPARECGLKQSESQKTYEKRLVTPCTGVWIETGVDKECLLDLQSLPARECGLGFPRLIRHQVKQFSFDFRSFPGT